MMETAAAQAETAAKADGGDDGPRRYRCLHVTTYHYSEPVSSSQLIAHLAPRPHPRQRATSRRLDMSPTPGVTDESVDWLGNPKLYAAIDVPHDTLIVTSELEIELAPPPPLVADGTPAWETVAATAAARGETAEFLFGSNRVPVPHGPLRDLAGPHFPPECPVAVGAMALMADMHQSFAFDPTATTVSTPVDAVLAARRGVCQDFAHVMIGALRGLGLPARYVSGYLRTVVPADRLGEWRGAAASHAWVQVWIGDGWLDLDPTNGVVVGTDHVTLAWGRDYDDVSPLRGVILGGGTHTLSVGVTVEPLTAADDE